MERIGLMDVRRWFGYAPAPKKIADEKPADDGTRAFVKAAAKRMLDRSEWDGEKPMLVTSEKLVERVAAAVAEAGCPVCAARRAKHAERVKKWREKKRG